MNYTSYYWRTEALIRSGYKGIKENRDRLIGARKFLKTVNRLKGEKRRRMMRKMVLLNEFYMLMDAVRVLQERGEIQTAKCTHGEMTSTLLQLTMEHKFRAAKGEAWYPESAHLLEVLTKAEVNAHPEDLYDGTPWAVVINLPEDFEMPGCSTTMSLLVMVATDRQICEFTTDFGDSIDMDSIFSQVGCDDHTAHYDVPLIHIATCDKDEYVVLDYPLESIKDVTKGIFQLRCITDGNNYAVGPGREHDIWSHMNLAIRLMVYAKAFPEVVVPMPDEKLKPGERPIPRRRMKAHPRIKQDPDTVRFITYRKAYDRRAHEKVLRAARFKKNEDGSPKTVPVKACHVPAIGYIGGRKMSIKELETAALRKISQESMAV